MTAEWMYRLMAEVEQTNGELRSLARGDAALAQRLTEFVTDYQRQAKAVLASLNGDGNAP